MKLSRPSFFFFSIIFAAASLVQQQASAQISAGSDWKPIAEKRFKAIYEQRAFKVAPFQAKWLDDSSGYTIQEKDPTTNRRKSVQYHLDGGKMAKAEEVRSTGRVRGRTFSPDGSQRLEVSRRILCIRDVKTKEMTGLTDKVVGRDVTFRNYQFSPDGSKVLFTEVEFTDVPERNVLIPKDPSYPGVQKHRFARVGEKIEARRVGVIDVATKNISWMPIDWPEEGCYLGQVEWTGSSEEVLVEKMSRFRDKRDFLIWTVGKDVKTIFHEENEAWAVGSQGKNSGLTWIQDGKSFIVISEKDGWRHAFLYSKDGQEIAVLTPGEYDVIDGAIPDEASGVYYFYASPNNGTQKFLYQVPLDGSGKAKRISPANQPGTHDYQFSPDCKWAFHTYSTMDQPPIIDLVELAGHKTVKVLENNQRLQDLMKKLNPQPTEFLQIRTEDGIEMDAWMMKPPNFDPSRTYPIFVYVYGEPYAQTVLDQWGAVQSHFHRVIAELGYLVVSIDNRGTPAPKGAAWRRSVFGSLGPLSTEDQAAALKQLGKMRPYVDLSRVGIWGWSGGGSNTLNAMFRKPDVYNVGIAVVPKPQPWLYNAWFQEIYMRTRETNADGYEKSAPINFAEGLEGDLLIMTGSGETNTHIQIIEGLVDRLIELGKQFDYMVYPNRDHGLREGKGSELHVRMLITRYLIQHLPRGPRTR